MEKSFYFEYAQKFFPQLVLSIVEKINERNKTKQTYMYKDLLNPDFSADGKWASILADYSRVAADVVSLDSELPLKKRDSLSTATGDIPKLGMKLYLTEKQMKDVDNMIAQGLPVNLIINKIFADTRGALKEFGNVLKTCSFPVFPPVLPFPRETMVQASDCLTGIRMKINLA